MELISEKVCMTKSGPQAVDDSRDRVWERQNHYDPNPGTLLLFPENRVCIFPFIYRDIVYYECANAGRGPTAFIC